MPDLLLVTEGLGSRTAAVIQRLRSLPGASKLQTLPIPSFETTDPEGFAAEVTLCLLRVAEAGIVKEPKAEALVPAVYQAHIALLQADAEARMASELDRVRRESAEQRAVELARLQAEAEERLRADVAAARPRPPKRRAMR